MTQWVLCDKCARAWRVKYPHLLPVRPGDEGEHYRGLLFGAGVNGPAERGTMRRGTAKHDMVCDHGDEPIKAGTEAWAIGVVVDGHDSLPMWEREYIDISSQ